MLPENKTTFLPKPQGFFFEKCVSFVGGNFNVKLNEKVTWEKHLMGTQATKQLAKSTTTKANKQKQPA